MSYQGSPDQVLMRAWLEQMPRNKRILAFKLYVSVAKIKDINKVPKSKSKCAKPRQSKTNMKKTIRIKRTQRITEYIADKNHHFSEHDKEDEFCGYPYTQKKRDSIRLWCTNPEVCELITTQASPMESFSSSKVRARQT